jgi:MFS family permease
MHSLAKPVSTRLMIFALAAAEMTCAIEHNMIFAVITTLYKTYGDPVRVGWLITAFLLTSSGAAAIGGRLGDLYGRNRVLICMVAVALVGSLIGLLGPSLEWVIAGRALQGASMAILPLCYGLLRENLSRERASYAIGILASVYSVGAGVGWVFGGIVVDHGHWRDIFYYSSSLAAIALVLVWRLVPASTHLPNARLDVFGGLLFLPAITLALLGITLAKYRGWLDMQIWLLIGAGVLLLAMWVWRELNHEQPLINVRLLGTRQIGLSNLTFLLLGVGPLTYAAVFFPLLQQPAWTGVGLGISATAASLLQIPTIAVAIAAALWSGRVASRTGARYALLAGCVVQASGFVLLAFFHATLWGVMLLLFVATGGMNIIFTTVPMLILDAAPVDRSSEATGLVQVVRSIGLAVGAQVIAFLLGSEHVQNFAMGAGSFPAPSAYNRAFAEIALCSILLIPLAFALPVQHKSRRSASGTATEVLH